MPAVTSMIITEENVLFMIDPVGATQYEIYIYLFIKSLYQVTGNDENFFTDEQINKIAEEMDKETKIFNDALDELESEMVAESLGKTGSEYMQ